MSTFIVKSPDTFQKLYTCFKSTNENIPVGIDRILELFQEIITNLEKDLLETKNEQKKVEQELKHQNKPSNSDNSKHASENSDNSGLEKRQETQEKKSHLEKREQALIHATTEIKQMLQKINALKKEFLGVQKQSTKGINALIEFEKLATMYLGINTSSGASSNKNTSSNNSTQNDPYELIGNTVHISNPNTSINQRSIDNALQQAKTLNLGNKNVNKVSFSNVPQTSFNVLKQNGFTIQQIEPNKFSAYKEL